MTYKQQLEARLADLNRYRDSEIKSPNGSPKYIDDLSVTIDQLEKKLLCQPITKVIKLI
jgi:hypothetical protein